MPNIARILGMLQLIVLLTKFRERLEISWDLEVQTLNFCSQMECENDT